MTGRERDRLRRAGMAVSLAGLSAGAAAAVLGGAAGFGTRLGLWHFRNGFSLLQVAVWVGVAALVVSICASLIAFRSRGWGAAAIAVAGTALASVVVAIPVTWKRTAAAVPAIHDISTDVVNPPRFVAILPLRRDAPNSAEPAGPETAALQKQAYPDVKTVVVPLPYPRAFAAALETAQSSGWEIVEAEEKDGRIEAVDTTFWFGFRDDIVIRVVAADAGRSLVDVRSVSRVGRSDVGTNAKRILTYLGRLPSA